MNKKIETAVWACFDLFYYAVRVLIAKIAIAAENFLMPLIAVITFQFFHVIRHKLCWKSRRQSSFYLYFSMTNSDHFLHFRYTKHGVMAY